MIYSDFYLISKSSGAKTLLSRATSKTFDTQDGFSASTISFSIPTEDARAVGLAEGSFIYATVDDYTLPTPFVIESSGWDYADVDSVSMSEFKGRSIHALGEDDVVLPSAWPNPTPSGHAFQNATPGTIIRTLISRSQERGKIMEWDVSSFSGTVDSKGKPWPAMMDREFSNGDGIYSAIKSIVDDGLVELEFDGFTLKAYVPGTLGVLRKQEDIIFRAGYSISEGSLEKDSSDFATDIFAIGEGGATAYETRPALYGVLGRRRTKFVQYAGISNVELLKVLAKADLDRYSSIKMEDSISVPHQIYQPMKDFFPGDWVAVDRGDGTNTVVKVKQISFSESTSGWSVGISLGTLLDSQEEKIQRRLDAITGANAGGGAVPSDKAQIKQAPAKPQNLEVSVQPYLDNQSRRKVIALADWSDVLVYDNGQPLGGVDEYEVSVKAGNATAYGPSQRVADSGAVFSGYDPDTKFQFRVKAYAGGYASAWVESPVVTLVDNTPLVISKPSAPELKNSWQTILVSWGGKNADGTYPSLDLIGMEVHLSAVQNFTPTSATRVGFIPWVANSQVGGNVVATDLEASTKYYVVFVPLGTKGTPGTKSDYASVTTAERANSAVVNQMKTDLDKAKEDLYNPGGTVDTIKNNLTSQITAAQSTANAAQTSANGKNTVFWSTSTPSDTENPGRNWGDVWYKYAVINNKTQILAQWYWYNTWVSTALSETFIPQLNIGTGTYGELDGIRLKAKSVQANNILVEGSAGTTVIADGAIITSKIAALAVTADQIAANAITADKIAVNAITANHINAQSIGAAIGEFVKIKADQITAGFLNATVGFGTSGIIIAGDRSSSYATMTKDGFATYGTDAMGVQYKATTLGGPGADQLSINGVDGEVASITNEGTASFNSVLADSDIEIDGKPVIGRRLDPDDLTLAEGYLDDLPQGTISYGDLRQYITPGTTLSTGVTSIGVVGFDLDYTDRYQITFPFRYSVSDIAGSNGRCGVGMTYTWSDVTDDPAEPTTSSAKIAESLNAYTVAVGEVTNNITFVWHPANYATTSRRISVKILIYAWSAGCQMTLVPGTGFDWQFDISNIGSKIEESSRKLLLLVQRRLRRRNTELHGLLQILRRITVVVRLIHTEAQRELYAQGIGILLLQK